MLKTSLPAGCLKNWGFAGEAFFANTTSLLASLWTKSSTACSRMNGTRYKSTGSCSTTFLLHYLNRHRNAFFRPKLLYFLPLMKVIAVIPAAGLGTRMAPVGKKGVPSKQFFEINGPPIIIPPLPVLLPPPQVG